MMTLALSGCASAVTSSFDLPSQYGHQPDGRYVLSAFEHGLDCDRLRESIADRLDNMAQLAGSERRSRQGLPPTLLSAIAWNTGANFAEGKRFREHRKLKAETDAFQQAMIEKACPGQIDLTMRYQLVAMPGTSPTGTANTVKNGPEL